MPSCSNSADAASSSVIITHDLVRSFSGAELTEASSRPRGPSGGSHTTQQGATQQLQLEPAPQPAAKSRDAPCEAEGTRSRSVKLGRSWSAKARSLVASLAGRLGLGKKVCYQGYHVRLVYQYTGTLAP